MVSEHVFRCHESCSILSSQKLVSSGRACLTFCPPPTLGTHRSIREILNLVCVTQGVTSLQLANPEKEKEILHIFMKVSQMENAIRRRMNLNSFLHGKLRDCGAVSWRRSGPMGRVIG